MHRVGAGLARGADVLGRIEIRRDLDERVRRLGVERAAVVGRRDGDRLEPFGTARAEDAQGDLAAVGYEHSAHGDGVYAGAGSDGLPAERSTVPGMKLRIAAVIAVLAARQRGHRARRDDADRHRPRLGARRRDEPVGRVRLRASRLGIPADPLPLLPRHDLEEGGRAERPCAARPGRAEREDRLRDADHGDRRAPVHAAPAGEDVQRRAALLAPGAPRERRAPVRAWLRRLQLRARAAHARRPAVPRRPCRPPKRSDDLRHQRAQLDEYVRGVVPSESPARWPIAELEAQAVAARSYALVELKPSAHYDLVPDTRNQVYGGMAAEHPRSNRAVEKTKGEILTYDGEVARTYYSSSSGGRTESSQDAWPGSAPIPYLRSVPDRWDTYSPNHDWGPYVYSTSQLAARLGLAGAVESARIQRNSSLRATSAWLRLSSGKAVNVGGEAIARSLGLRSHVVLDRSAVAGDEHAARSVRTLCPHRRARARDDARRAPGAEPGRLLAHARPRPGQSPCFTVEPHASTAFRLRIAGRERRERRRRSSAAAPRHAARAAHARRRGAAANRRPRRRCGVASAACGASSRVRTSSEVERSGRCCACARPSTGSPRETARSPRRCGASSSRAACSRRLTRRSSRPQVSAAKWIASQITNAPAMFMRPVSAFGWR